MAGIFPVGGLRKGKWCETTKSFTRETANKVLIYIAFNMSLTNWLRKPALGHDPCGRSILTK
jgi:hypothetical protein